MASSDVEISVLMSVFNGQAYLGEAIASILRQEGVQFELIVVNDASTDGSADILRAVKDHRVRVLSAHKNMGLVDALNWALEIARGSFVARMDADDVAYPGRLHAQWQRMKAQRDLVLLGCAFDYLDGSGRKFGEGLVRTGNALLQLALANEGNQFCHSSVMMPVGPLRAVGGYRKLAGRYAQDYDLWLRLAEIGSIDNLPAALMGYRCHPDMVSIAKLPLQRRAAEIYKVLARQRKGGQSEDVAGAERLLDSDRREFANILAADYLSWSDLYSKMGEPGLSRQMMLNAIRSAPLGKVVRQRVVRAVRWRLSQVFS